MIAPYPVWACALVFFWSLSIRTLIYTVMPTVATDLGLSNSVAGVVISTLLLGNCAGTWAAGWLPGSRKARVLVGVVVSLPAAAMMSAANELWVLLGAALLLGLGAGVYLPLGLGLIVDAGGGSSKASYVAVHEVCAALASFGGSAAVAVLLTWTDWRGCILAWCPVGVVALLAFAAVRDKDGKVPRREISEPLSLSRSLIYCCIAQSATSVLLMGILSVLPLIMVRVWGLHQTFAASIVGYSRLAGLVGVLTAGLRGDRWGHARLLRWLQTVSLGGTLAMSLDGYGVLFLAGMLAIAVGGCGTVTLLPLIIAGAFPAAQRERALAVSLGVGSFVGTVVCPALFGALVDLGMPTAPMVFAAAATVAAILVIGRISAGLGQKRTEGDTGTGSVQAPAS